MNDLNTAIKYHRIGEIIKAQEIYQQILSQEPDNSEVLHLLAILSAQLKEFSQAKTYLERAIKINPKSPTINNSMGNIYKALNKLAQASKYYLKALEINPNYAVAHNNLANILLKQNNLSKAQEHYLQAIKLSPQYADANYNLAVIMEQKKQPQKVLYYLNQALEIDPDHLEANNKKARILQQQNKLQEAIPYYEKCLKSEPNETEIYHNLGSIYLALNKPEQALKYFLRILNFAKDFDAFYNIGLIYMLQEKFSIALDYFNQALNIKPKDNATHENMAVIFLKNQDYVNAIKHYEVVLKQNPNKKDVKYILTALKQNKAPTKAPAEYIENLFDQYALHFDKHLQILDYQVPKLLYKAVIEELNSNKKINILDLGCGTGLCGIEFKNIANKLVGIDLSSKMIAIAKQKKVYDELIVGDITNMSFPQKRESRKFDLIIAADTLVYMGKLNKIFASCNKLLAPNGILAFTTEKTHTYPYELLQSARFAHCKKYIQEEAEKNNLQILSVTNAVLRKQNNEAIGGYLYLMNGIRYRH